MDRLARTDTKFVRYLHSKINWNSRLVVVTGARGVGKTTMRLQHIKLSEAESSSLYISADNIYFTGNSLYDVASKFHKLNGQHYVAPSRTASPMLATCVRPHSFR